MFRKVMSMKFVSNWEQGVNHAYWMLMFDLNPSQINWSCVTCRSWSRCKCANLTRYGTFTMIVNNIHISLTFLNVVFSAFLKYPCVQLERYTIFLHCVFILVVFSVDKWRLHFSLSVKPSMFAFQVAIWVWQVWPQVGGGYISYRSPLACPTPTSPLCITIGYHQPQ